MKAQISTLIVDDEQDALDVMSYIIDKFIPELKVMGLARSSNQAYELILEHQPQLLLLDIDIGSTSEGETIFNLLSRVPVYGYKIIFVTAFNEYAIQAIKWHAFDYLLKPINVRELTEAVHKLQQQMSLGSGQDRIQGLSRYFEKGRSNLPIWLPTSKGFKRVFIQDVVWVKAVEHYTEIFAEGEVTFSNHAFKDIKEVLSQDFFFWVHRSYLINTRQIREIVVKGDNMVVMVDGTEIPIARNRKKTFLNFIAEQ